MCIQSLISLPIFSKIIYRVSAQWHARRQPLSLNLLHLHSSSPSSINLPEGSQWHSKYRRASCARDSRQQGLLGVTESPGPATEQGGRRQCFIIIL